MTTLPADELVEQLRAQVASLQKELAERTAERDDARAEIEHWQKGATCGCRYDSPDDVCDLHSPAVAAEKSRADTLARRVEGLTDLAEAVVFHYFNCMDGGGEGCGELRPSMAKLAKEIGYRDPSVDDEIDAALTGERP